ncbi:hypothetical protein GCM10027160_00420 [Streptomyces calidiresistens]
MEGVGGIGRSNGFRADRVTVDESVRVPAIRSPPPAGRGNRPTGRDPATGIRRDPAGSRPVFPTPCDEGNHPR